MLVDEYVHVLNDLPSQFFQSAAPGECCCMCYNYKQLAKLYGVSYDTLKRWLKPFATEIGPVEGRILNPRQVRLIFEKLGNP